MINLIETMSKECFEEVRVPFEARGQHELSSEDAESQIRVILDQHKVPGAMGLAMFLASVCSGIRWEPPDSDKWVQMRDNCYLDKKTYDETVRSTQAQYTQYK